MDMNAQPTFEQWFRNAQYDLEHAHGGDIEQIRAIAKTAYDLGKKSPDSLALRVCKTLEGLAMLEEKINSSFPHWSDVVYRFCHIARCECKNPHLDWMKQFEEMEAEIHEACAAPADKKKKHYDSIEVGKKYWITYDDPDYPCDCPCHTSEGAIRHCIPCCRDNSYTGEAVCVQKRDDQQLCIFEDPRNSLHKYALDPYSVHEIIT